MRIFMSSSQDLILKGKIKRETQKALLISFANGRESWVPKSVISSNFDANLDSIQDFDIAKWFLEKNNIILDESNPNIFGRSGSVMYLKGRLVKKGIYGFETFQDIQDFKKNFKNILANSTKEEREKLNSIIDALKSDEQKLIEELKEKRAEFKESLIKEKQDLLEREFGSKEKRRVKRIDKILEKNLDKPFKKDLKQIKKTEKKIVSREKNIEKEIANSTKGLRKTQNIIKNNIAFVSGAVGETAAIRELKKLPESFFILNKATLSFSRAIRWRKYHQYAKSCKIDHVVVGPTGIFLIETKNWNPQRIYHTKFTPHMQIDRAGYIFFIHMMDYFNCKFPVYKVVATYRKLPEINYNYVDQMTIRELVNYILKKKEKLASHDVLRIFKWLKSGPHINNYKFRRRWFF